MNNKKINFEKKQSQIGETSAPYVHDQKDKNHDVESHRNDLDSTSSTNNESTEVSNELHNHIDDSYYKVKKKYCLIWNKTHLTNIRH